MTLRFYILLLLSISVCAAAHGDPQLRLREKGRVEYRSADGSQALSLTPHFTILYRADDPELHYRKYSPEYADGVTLPAWRLDGENVTVDYFAAGKNFSPVFASAALRGDTVVWKFRADALFLLEARVYMKDSRPVVDYAFTARRAGWFSVGFTGMPAVEPAALQELWQPWIWNELRFPEAPYLSTEEMCPASAVLVRSAGLTYGLAADPGMLPYRLPKLREGNIRFGVTVRDPQSMACPSLFAPVLGNRDSHFGAGETFRFSAIVLASGENIDGVHRRIVRELFAFSDYRSNVGCNLNRTLENMVDFAMNDELTGWNPVLRGFDYAKDVSLTVKNVSALHPLSVALVTDQEDVYARRGRPMAEFNLSRERFLFTVYDNVRGQNASGRMSGPGVEVAELGAMDAFFGGNTPLLARFARQMQDSARVLNLNTESRGDSWQDLLGLYEMGGGETYLRQAIAGADDYIAWRMSAPQKDFSMAGVDNKGTLSSGDLTSQFCTDYVPAWIELLHLYEVSGERRFLDAAETGARAFCRFVWFSPRIPKGNVTAEGREIPAWTLSQVGLTPEASNTFNHNPAIYLAHFAAHLLRLAQHTGDGFYRDVARSAVVGRYANFPGYSYGSAYTTAPHRPDFPLNPSLHGTFYNNHIWPQIALLYDYLVTDAWACSGRRVRFPALFVPAYAYLKSNVYGHAPGEFYGDKNVKLYMPRQLVETGHEQLNYLAGYGNGNLYLCLLNQSQDGVEAEISIDPWLTDLDPSRDYRVRVWRDNAPEPVRTMNAGRIALPVTGKGITAVAIEGLNPVTAFQHRIYGAPQPQNGYKIFETPYGEVVSTMFGPAVNRSLYLWLRTRDAAAMRLQYRFDGKGDWFSAEKTDFPYEHTVVLPPQAAGVEFSVTLSAPGRETYTTEISKL